MSRSRAKPPTITPTVKEVRLAFVLSGTAEAAADAKTYV